MKSKRAENRRDWADACCQQLRADLAEHGGVTSKTFRYLSRWMANAGKMKYAKPKPIKKSTDWEKRNGRV